MKYILDFDRTVFDMDRLYTVIDDTNPDATVGTVESLNDIDISQFLFTDALMFFASHEAADIEIVSSCYGKTNQWDIDYQTEKVRRSGIHELVKAVHVVSTDKVATIAKIAKDSPAVFVDDHPEHVAALTGVLLNVTTVYMDRLDEFAASEHVLRINSLTELDAIIAS